jgi:subtilisin-like proprotein convertase family protein
MGKITTTILLVIITIVCKAQTYSWSGFMPIFDFGTDTVRVTVSGLPSSIDTTFGIAHICIDITHTYDADLTVRIVSPAGNSVNLIQTKGGSGNNFTGTCMGMDGTSFSNSAAPYTGLFAPIGNMASFNNGQNPNGDWLLIVSDQANADTGSIHNVSIAFTNNPPNQSVTAPTSGPTGTYVWPGAVCPGGNLSCDLLPDMTASGKEIMMNHNETPGALYISNATPNIGYGPIEIYGIDTCYCGNTLVPCGTICPNGEDIQHVIKQRIYQKVAGNDTLTFYDRTAGRMTYHATHGHLHVDNWASYTLRTATSNPDATTWPIIGTGTKQSFCLVNLGTCSGNNGECVDNNGNTLTTVPNQNLGFHTGCGQTQGIYPGNYDVYSISLNDPIPLVNVCNGNYYIVSITDPDNNFIESDETNNWIAVPITLTQQNVAPTITSSGPSVICQGDSVTLTASLASNYAWSTGETTQSIVVKNQGAYTVSSNCGTSVGTSQPYNLTVNQINLNAEPATSSICSGTPVQLTSNATSNGTQNAQVTFTSNQQVFIPDNVSAGVTSAIPVSGISPSTLSANTIVSVKLNLTHTYDGDLAISLIAPSGNTIYLSNRRGGGGDNFINTVFTMSASTLISAGAAPFTGSYKPDGNFASLSGNVNGTWTLRVQDLASVDTGRIRDWSITINNQVQETFSYTWTSQPGGFNSTQQNPVVSPIAFTTYNVQATSSSTGCTSSSSVIINVLNIQSYSPLNGPPGSVITINGEGFSGTNSVTLDGSGCAFTVISDNQLQVIVPNTTSGSLCVSNSNCTLCAGNFTITNGSTININMKIFIEGFYLGAGMMEASVDPVNYPSLCDTVVLELRSALSPYSVLYSCKSTISTSGNGIFEFPSQAEGNSYYFVIRHRNAIETWSANAMLVSNNLSYDFTNAPVKAFGNNLISLGDGNFALYSGDISDGLTSQVGIQDGVIESQDYSDMENAVSAILTGYIPQDITGDQIAESLDYSIMENNVGAVIFVIRP